MKVREAEERHHEESNFEFLWRNFLALREAMEILTEVLEVVMATEDQLGQDVGAVEADEASLKAAVASQVADIQAEIDSLKQQIPNPAVLDGLDQRVQALHSSLAADTAAVQASDPGAPPAPAPGQ